MQEGDCDRYTKKEGKKERADKRKKDKVNNLIK